MIPLLDFSASIFCIDLLFAVVMLSAGIAAGWLLSPRGIKNSAVESENTQEAIDRLRELASTVAADVGEHASRMQAINTNLTEAQASGDGLEAVVSGSVADILRANEELQQKLATAEVRLQRQEEELKNQLEAARTDALTGVCNRRAFDDELSRRVAEWQRRKTMFSLVILDVDHFKKFNDTHGHQAGDAVLKGVAKALRETVREMDFVGRYGGEEFAAILPVTNEREALVAGERIRAAVQRAVFRFEGTDLCVTCSVGVAQVLADHSPAEMIKRADSALYASKKGGRNCVYYQDGETCLPAPVSEASELPRQPEPDTATVASPVTDVATIAMEEDETQTGFHVDLRRRVAEARKFHVPLSLMLIDIDAFEELGDKFGTAISDLVYDTMADFLSVVMQEMDVASRRGNGQFAIMMPGTDLATAVAVAERLRTAVEGHTMQVKGVPLRVTLSTGLAETMEHDDSSTLTRRAGAALFAARNSGRNCTYLHDGEKCEMAAAALALC